MEKTRGQPLCVLASARRRSQECGAWSEARTKGENSELPHVFWKHKNEETRVETKGVRDVEGRKKKVDSCRRGRGGGEGLHPRWPNGTLMVNGGLRLTRSLTGQIFSCAARSLSVPCSCCCVFSTSPNPPPPPLSLPGPLSVFCLLRLAKFTELHAFS